MAGGFGWPARCGMDVANAVGDGDRLLPGSFRRSADCGKIVSVRFRAQNFLVVIARWIMSRSGYTDDFDDGLAAGRWRAQVRSAIRGNRGQSFLRELLAALDAMPVKQLIAEELVTADGQCCTIGVVCKSRGIDVSRVDYEDPESVGKVVGIAHQMAAEIEYMNDECGPWDHEETSVERWQRMRNWVESQLVKVTQLN